MQRRQGRGREYSRLWRTAAGVESRVSSTHAVSRYGRRFAAFLAIHYKFNTRLDTPFWRACRADVDLGQAAGIVDYYQQNGPSDLWQETLVSPHDIFGLDGYYTMLFGMQVPFERAFTPSAKEAKLVVELKQVHRRLAKIGIGSEEALELVRSPAWRWPAETFLP